jgi:hypothetical protein
MFSLLVALLVLVVVLLLLLRHPKRLEQFSHPMGRL